MFEKIKANISSKRLTEEKLYAQVSNEILSGKIRDGIWAKATADAGGVDAKAKSLYIKYRVKAIQDETIILDVMQEEEEKEEKEKLYKIAEKKRIAEKERSDKEFKQGKDKFIRLVRIPLSLLLVIGSIQMSINSYDRVQAIASWGFIPLAIWASWYWWWLDVD